MTTHSCSRSVGCQLLRGSCRCALPSLLLHQMKASESLQASAGTTNQSTISVLQMYQCTALQLCVLACNACGTNWRHLQPCTLGRRVCVCVLCAGFALEHSCLQFLHHVLATQTICNTCIQEVCMCTHTHTILSHTRTHTQTQTRTCTNAYTHMHTATQKHTRGRCCAAGLTRNPPCHQMLSPCRWPPTALLSLTLQSHVIASSR